MNLPFTRQEVAGRHAVASSLAVLALVAVGGCSTASQGETTAGAGGVHTVDPAGIKSAPQSTATATRKPVHSAALELPAKIKVPVPKDPLASKTRKPVIRNGKTPRPEVTAATQEFNKPVKYTDGLALQITKIEQGKVMGEGPGVFPGRPMTTFSVTLTNATRKTVTLNKVVAMAQYGNPARVARPVYDESSRDFSGTVAAGHVAKAAYVFSVPKPDLTNVTMIIDFDGVHNAATFTGTVK